MMTYLWYVAYLRPSRELLEYYRKKIAEFDDEHESMLQKLDQYKMTYEEQVSLRMFVCRSNVPDCKFTIRPEPDSKCAIRPEPDCTKVANRA